MTETGEMTLQVQLEETGAGRARVLAPSVGSWSDHPRPGDLLAPGAALGWLRRLNRRFLLVMPQDRAGRVAGGLPRDKVVPVEYAQSLFALAPLGAEDAAGETRAEHGEASTSDLPPGAVAVVSPTEGVFYRRPAPDAEPFVEIGGRVIQGQPVGLVEVMKTFNQIVYEGVGFPAEAEVLEVRCGDTEEVRAGQVLIVLR
jgi:biotin carboxyl carrier protein